MHDLERCLGVVGLGQRLADLHAFGQQEGVGHGAADDQPVDLGHEMGEHVDLARHLGAADHGGRRALGLLQHAHQRVDLLHQQRPGIGRQQPRNRVGGGVRAMRRRERVVDEQVAERGQPLGELGVVLLLALVEAQVLEHGDLPGQQRSDRALRRLADAVGREDDGMAEQLAQLVRHGLQAELGIGAALGPAEMRDHDDARAASGQVLQARDEPLEPRRVGDLAVRHGHVEIGADDDALALQIEPGRGLQLVEIHHRHRLRVRALPKRRPAIDVRQRHGEAERGQVEGIREVGRTAPAPGVVAVVGVDLHRLE